MARSKVLKIHLPEHFYDALQEVSENAGLSMSSFMASLLAQHMDGPETTPIRARNRPETGPNDPEEKRARNDPDPGPKQARNGPETGPSVGGIGGNGSFSGEETKKTKTTTTGGAGGSDPDFEAFYSAYPRKQKRPDALKAWGQTAAIRPALDVVLASVAKWSTSLQWTKDGGIFVPLPASWLRSEGWNDVPAAAPLAKVDPRTLVPLSPEWYEHQRATMRVVL